jgi:hypothetical protein
VVLQYRKTAVWQSNEFSVLQILNIIKLEFRNGAVTGPAPEAHSIACRNGALTFCLTKQPIPASTATPVSGRISAGNKDLGLGTIVKSGGDERSGPTHEIRQAQSGALTG